MEDDWNDIWDHEVSTTSRRHLDDADFWEGRVESVQGKKAMSEMTEWQLSVISADDDDVCLDIGCGTGRLAIPLSRKCRRVTALDGSQSMLDSLMHEAVDQSIDNIDPIHSSWQNFNPAFEYDVAYASFSIFMKDVRRQLERMTACSERTAVFASDDLRIPVSAQKTIFGCIRTQYTDAQMIYNICKEMGLEPKLEIRRFPRPWIEETEEQTASRLSVMYDVDKDDPKLLRYIRSDYRRENEEGIHVGAVTWKRH